LGSFALRQPSLAAIGSIDVHSPSNIGAEWCILQVPGAIPRSGSRET
jgi:hypothetical protein